MKFQASCTNSLICFIFFSFRIVSGHGLSIFPSAKATKSRKKRFRIWRWWNLLKSSKILEVFNFWPKNFQKQQMLKNPKNFCSNYKFARKIPPKILVGMCWSEVPLKKFPRGGGKGFPQRVNVRLREIDMKWSILYPLPPPKTKYFFLSALVVFISKKVSHMLKLSFTC